MKRRLIIFTRYPEPGTTKTRMIPELGRQGAADLQRDMTEHVVRRARRFTESRNVNIEVRFDGGTELLMKDWLGDRLEYVRQGNGDLGNRLKRAFRDAFDAGCGKVVIVGTDCPALDVETMATAFDGLDSGSVVIGPAKDGGYYLIGLTRPIPELFDDIEWGGPTVLETTLGKASALGVPVVRLRVMPDVDRPEDLAVWERERIGGLPLISVVIPALDEATCIGEVLAAASRGRHIEIILADGGSTDGTPDIARSYGARVVVETRGRAWQINEGVRMASGEILLIVHADTILPHGYADHVRSALSSQSVSAGAFEFRLDTLTPSLNVITWFTNLRSRFLQMPYGDQTLFMKKTTFDKVGGFPEIPIMEDLEIVRRLRRFGRIVTVPVPAVTSARRWRNMGVWRTTARNGALVAAYHLGISPDRIARWYQRRRGVAPLPPAE